MDTKKKKKLVWIWIAGVVLVLIILALVGLNALAKAAAKPVYASYTVTSGDLSKTITGSGKLEAADSETLRLPAGVTVQDVLVYEGDAVTAGQTLAILDANSLQDCAATVSSDLSALDRQIASRSTVSSVKAPARGRVKYLPASEGDAVLAVVSQNSSLALLSTDGLMQVEVQTDAALALYDTVQVSWADGKANGRVAQKTVDGWLVTLSDEKAPYGEAAQVMNGETLLGEGTLEIHAPVSVLASGGIVSDVRCELGEIVYANNILFALDEEPDSASYRQALADRVEKEALYRALLGYMADPRVLAPADGVVSGLLIEDAKDVAATQDSSGLSDALTLRLGGAVKMRIDVDELDINSVSLGQTASVTMDAFPGESFRATVTHISRIGTSAGSITTYPVEVTLSGDPRLLEGMNGSAVITTADVKGVLLVPLDATSEDSEGVYVYVRGADGETLERRDITLGLSDGTNAEVLSGLAVNDVIWFEDTSATPQSILATRMANNRAKYEQQSVTAAPAEGN